MHKHERKNIRWFTIVELVVAMTILLVLTGLWFYSYTQNVVDARDSVRISDIASVSSQLKLYKKARWAYPLPGDSFNILNQWRIVGIQWLLNENVTLTTLDKIPYDPSAEIPYVYSVTRNKQEFQLALTLESSENGIAVLEWDYKTVSRNVLPTLVLALSSWWDREINNDHGWSANRRSFVFNEWYQNLPYTHDGDNAPYTGASSFSEAIDNPNIKFWQNSDFRDCDEIFESGKHLTNSWDTEIYQILNSSGSLVDTDPGCTFTY